MGPGIDIPQIRVLAEFGIVFLLFTIGLNFSLPQIHALRHQVLGLETGQVLFTTAANHGGEDQGRLIEIAPDCQFVGSQLGELDLGGITVITIIQSGHRRVMSPLDTRIAANDVLVMYGSLDELQHAERIMLQC